MKVLIDDTSLKMIADEIRTSTERDDTYLPSEMWMGVCQAYGAGRDFGNAEGIEAGKQAEREEFWGDYFPIETNEVGLYRCFFAGCGWNAKTFSKVVYPQEKITPIGSGAERMFAWFNRNRGVTSNPNAPIDLTEFCKHADFSKCTSTNSTFNNARVENITLDLSSCENINYLFHQDNGGYINKVVLKLTETTTSATYAFGYNYDLKELTFTDDSTIATSINLQWSYSLTKASFESTINALSSAVTGKTATFSKKAKEAAFTADEWAALIATKPNWTISLA